MEKTIAIVLFERAEELDFVGPWQVLRVAADGNDDWRVVTVGPTKEMLTCSLGLQVAVEYTFDELANVDVVIVPGGPGSMPGADNEAAADWLRRVAPGCELVTSVCTGAFLIVTSGLCAGRKITTHAWFIDRLKELGDCDVVEDVRFVRDGKLVSAAGVMSGIDMALWLAGELFGEDAKQHARGYIAYDHPPRDATEGV